MTAESTPRSRSRILGVVYFLYFLTAIFAQFLSGRGFIAYGNAVNVIANLLYVATTVLFFYLFKPVSKRLSLTAFFGPHCILIGYLILRSNFLPRVLGVLMLLAGLGWLLFLSPLGYSLTTYIEVLGILGEGLLM
jgi:Domain of unknown function (DUF4386)